MHLHQKLTALILAAAATSFVTGGKITSSPAPATTISSAQADPSFEAIRNRFKSLLAGGGQYMVQQCVDADTTDPALQPVLKPYLDHPNAANLKLRDCKYTNSGLKGRVLMVNADADQLARWTISACQATHQKTTAQCLTAVVNDLWCPSNAQFPISGTVVEPAENCNSGSGSALIAFRDGVTVVLKSFKPPSGRTCVKQQLTANRLAEVLAESPLRSAFYARVANTHRDLLMESGVPQDKLGRSPVNGKIPYLETVRTTYLDAFGKDDYAFLSTWAIENEKAGFFERFKNMPLGQINVGCFYAETSHQISKNCNPH
jgi:hypothetical protein